MALGKKQRLVGLDIGSRTLKVAEVIDSKKGFQVKSFGAQDIMPGWIEEGVVKNPEEVADAIKQLFKAFNIKERNVAISIGGYSIIVKTIDVQSMPEDQLQEQINFEAEQYIPFDINDVNLDFQILGENESNPNQMSVLLVAAKKEMVQDYVSLINLAGLNPVIIDVDAFALQNIYEANYSAENENVALIDIGANKTTLNILKGDRSVFMRDVTLGCHQINAQIMEKVGCSVDEAEQYYQTGETDQMSTADLMQIVSGVAGDWCAEIRRALDYFYSTYPGDQISQIILSGGGANIETFTQQLSSETDAEVAIIDPFKKFDTGGMDSGYLQYIAPQAAICMGLGIRRVDEK
jgi:type IV pilus assembly protein PilM